MSELLSRSASRNAAFCIFNQSNLERSGRQLPLIWAQMTWWMRRPVRSELAVRLHTLVTRKRELDQMRASVQDGLRLAMIDPLTGLHNRRYGLAQLNAIAARSQQESSEFAVMVVDLDRFKSVNDRWGHAAGDAVLVEISSRIAANLRASDLVARIGGEEFLIALPNTTRAEAGIVAQRLCEAAEAQPVVLADGSALQVTISIGMTIDGGPADACSVAECGRHRRSGRPRADEVKGRGAQQGDDPEPGRLTPVARACRSLWSSRQTFRIPSATCQAACAVPARRQRRAVPRSNRARTWSRMTALPNSSRWPRCCT